MKFLHTADWHLGKIIYGQPLLKEQEHFIDSCFFPIVKSERPDAVLICGDIFDRRIAPAAAIELFDSVINRLSTEMNVPVCAITGNHDGAERMTLGARLLSKAGVYLTTRLEDYLTPVHFSDEYGDVFVYNLPYFDPSQLRAVFGEDIRGFAAAYKAVIGKIRDNMDMSARNVLLAHCFVNGCTVSDSEAPLYIGGSGEIPSDLFEGFDYVALGHLHAPQQAGERVWYSGSPLKYSFDEVNQKKAILTVELGAKGTAPSVKKNYVAPAHDMRVVTGTIEELKAAAHADKAAANDYIYAVLTDDAPVFEPMAQLREVYPNILGLKNMWLKGAAFNAERADLRETVSRKSDDMLILREFFKQICGEELAEEEEKILRDLLMREVEDN